MNISAGKLRAMRRLADSDGRFKMVAVDQRPPLLKALAPKLAPRTPGYDELSTVKALLAETLTPHGSAVLIDPDYGYSLAERVIPPHKGLLITLEDFNFEDTPGGRKTRLMRDWSVSKIKRMGADGVKLLLWYRPDAAKDVLDHQRALVKTVGQACRDADLPFLLELLVYPFAGTEGHTADYTENPGKYPELVLQSLADFADPDYGVDIYKLESPVLAAGLPDPDAGDEASRATQALFAEMAGMIDRPWVMLSAGASMDVFRRVLTYAYRAGANGYLAGRAIWWPAFQAWPDLDQMRRNLAEQAVGYVAEINALTESLARPWEFAPCFAGTADLANAGHDFPALYPDFRKAS
jgi:tagatose 1,6-diphosphate aldolase